jgi:hypothetical protein
VSALESIMQHVYHLSVGIGPRGSCTPAEAEAARYTESVYRRLGLEPVVQPIVSARSAWSGYGAIAGLGLRSPAWAGGLNHWIDSLAVLAGIALVDRDTVYREQPRSGGALYATRTAITRSDRPFNR